MNKEFIPYEQALELRQLGFDEPCFAWYNIKGDLLSDLIIGYEPIVSLYKQEDMDNNKQCIAPLYQQVFRWFRENQGLYSYIEMQVKNYDYKNLLYGYRIIDYPFRNDFNNYEEAELACLKKLIEIVKNK